MGACLRARSMGRHKTHMGRHKTHTHTHTQTHTQARRHKTHTHTHTQARRHKRGTRAQKRGGAAEGCLRLLWGVCASVRGRITPRVRILCRRNVLLWFCS